MSELVGGLSPEVPADAEIQNLIAPFRNESQRLAHQHGWNGLFTQFVTISYSTQVVAGINYFVKVQVSRYQFIHLRVFKPLPIYNEPPYLTSIQIDHTLEDPIEYF